MSRSLALLLFRLLALAPDFSLARLLGRFLTGSFARSLSRFLSVFAFLLARSRVEAVTLARSSALARLLARWLSRCLALSLSLCRWRVRPSRSLAFSLLVCSPAEAVSLALSIFCSMSGFLCRSLAR